MLLDYQISFQIGSWQVGRYPPSLFQLIVAQFVVTVSAGGAQTIVAADNREFCSRTAALRMNTRAL